MYKDEDNKESFFLLKLDLNEKDLTEDFTAMIYAMWVLYRKITGEEIDVLGFTHIANRLVFQKFVKERSME